MIRFWISQKKENAKSVFGFKNLQFWIPPPPPQKKKKQQQQQQQQQKKHPHSHSLMQMQQLYM